MRALHSPRQTAVLRRERSGVWTPATWSELWSAARHMAEALRVRGLVRGDRLAILARTSREWQVAEIAGFMLGAVIVGIDPYAPPVDREYILRHSQADALLVDDPGNITVGRFKFVALLGSLGLGKGEYDELFHPS